MKSMIDIQDVFAETINDVSKLIWKYEEIAGEFGNVRIDMVVTDLEAVRVKAVRHGC